MALFTSYDDNSLREDLTDIIVNISPTETPFTTGMPATKATQRVHEWHSDVLVPAFINKVIEGSDATFPTLSGRTRLFNVTQILRKTWLVSDSDIAFEKAGIPNSIAYEIEKATKELATDLEISVINGVLDAGSSGVAREMDGVLNTITTNIVDAASSSLTEDRYNDLAELIAVAGGSATETHVNTKLKRLISSFTASSTKFDDAAARRVINQVSVYEGDFGVQNIFYNRYVPGGGVGANILLLVQKDMYSLAWARPFINEVLAKTGGAMKGQIEGEVTLRFGNELAAAKFINLNAT